eukprot:UN01226
MLVFMPFIIQAIYYTRSDRLFLFITATILCHNNNILDNPLLVWINVMFPYSAIIYLNNSHNLFQILQTSFNIPTIKPHKQHFN